MNEIKITCDVKDHLPIAALHNLQGNLKSLSTENYLRLKKQIEKYGFCAPIFIWKNGKNNFILDGNQRYKTVSNMISEGTHSCSKLPVVYIDAKSQKEAKEILLSLVSQYGKTEEQGLYEFTIGADFEPSFLLENFDIPGIDMPTFLEGHFDGFKADPNSTDEDPENIYTQKIEAPIYEPKGDKPSVSELVDPEKMKSLISEIESADIPKDEKEFLKLAAYRHNVFNYQNIAEYYAHSSPAVKDLMEKSALVIIDFNKAIELGFVKLVDDVVKSYLENESNATNTEFSGVADDET
jgi:hypothetical protein